MKTLLVLGGSGLVGQQVLQLALQHSAVGQVCAPTRRPLPAHAKLLNPMVDYERLAPDAPWWQADAVICTLGTTLKLAGSAAAFRHVDHDYVLTAARLAAAAGCRVFAYNSSLGAAPQARSFYLRVKGETEQHLRECGFASLTLVRPSLLDGGPRPERRPAEACALLLARLMRPVLPARYRAASTARVALALLQAALEARPGVTVIESEALPWLDHR